MHNISDKSNLTSDEFIALLYCKASDIALENFAHWALDLLQQVIPFDGAIWATGHVATEQFHTQTTVDVSPEIFSKLKQYLTINPIFDTLLSNKGQAVDMADVLNDKEFYQSTLYQECFQPFGIERILSSIHLDDRSGIFTLLTLYRYDRTQVFTAQEKQQQNRLLFHLLNAASHRQFIALAQDTNIPQLSNQHRCASALCDKHGIYHAVEASFLDLLKSISNHNEQALPFELDEKQSAFTIDNLYFTQTRYADLFRLTVRGQHVLDQLSEREKEVVDGVCQGLTFKQIAKELSLSPSTVSNHLYRVYNKLNIHSRAELVNQIQQA